MARSLSDEVSARAMDLIADELAPRPQNPIQRSERIEELQSMAALANDVNDLAHSVERMVNSTVELVRLGIVVQAELQRISLETRAKQDRLATLAPGAMKVLESLGVRIDDLIARASAIDPRSCPESELRWRNRLMDLAHKHTETLNDGLMMLLS